MKHRYNWKPDTKDHRDHMMAIVAPAVAVTLPVKADLRPNCPPIFDQGDLGSCTANALGGCLGYLELQQIKANTPVDQAPEEYAGKTFQPPSRLFVYYNERMIEGTVDSDSGAMLRDGVQALNQWGACAETLWTYDTGNAFTKPLDSCYADALKHKISTYTKLSSLSQMKLCLFHGFPFAFGITVYESFESDHVAQTGMVPMPGAYEEIMGGHAVCCVGYDDSTQHLIVRNSWGTGWGDKGYFYLPYNYVLNPNLAQDFWTIRK